MNRIAAFLILLGLFAAYSSDAQVIQILGGGGVGSKLSLPSAKTNTASVRVNGVWTGTIASNPTLGVASQRRTTVFMWGHNFRIRQSGKIVKAVFRAETLDAKLDGWYFEIWRRRTGNRFDLVCTTVNLRSRLTATSLNTLTLNPNTDWIYETAEAGPHQPTEGDYYACAVTATDLTVGSNCWSTTDSTNTVERYVFNAANENQVSPKIGFQWFTQSSLTVNDILVEFYMAPPQVVFLGYSQFAGDNIFRSFRGAATLATDTVRNDLTNNSPSYFMKTYRPGATYQNMGKGGDKATDIQSRGSVDCYGLKPRWAVIQMGGQATGDLNRPLSIVYNAVSAVLDSCNARGIYPIVMAITAATANTNANMAHVDSLNSALANLVANHASAGRFVYSPKMGKNRGTGPTGNLWDIQTSPAYAHGDGLHFTALGQQKFASIIDESLTLLSDPTP